MGDTRMTPQEIDALGGLIGGFLVNFGAAEFASFLWIDKFSTDKIVRDIAIGLPLHKRLELVCTLIRRSDLAEERKQRALELWGEVAKIATLRNTVAHNPIVTNRKTGEVGVIDVKKMRGVGPYQIEPLQPADLATAGKRLATLLQELAVPF